MNQDYSISDPECTSRLIARLAKNWRIAVSESADCLHTFYDSFDWRLYTNNMRLEAVGDDLGAQQIIFTQADRQQVFWSEQTPKFANDLPEAELGKVLEMRALMPQSQMICREISVAILNRDEKTVARLKILEPVGENTLSVRLTLLPVRGYNKVETKIRGILEGEFALPYCQADWFHDLLQAAGRHPGDYSSKLKFIFTPELSADETVKAIFQHLLNTLKRNEPGLREEIDSEFLHDFRVAVRRTRSALTQLKPMLPSVCQTHFKQEFAWLGQVTGLARDLDVYLLKLPDYQQQLPPEMRDDLEPLRALLLANQQVAYRHLVKILDDERYQALLHDWAQFLNNWKTGDGLPVKSLADSRIWKIYRRVLREGEAITPDSPAEWLHELRKSCKKLRYMLEFFQSLYDAETMHTLIKALKQLQENLGDFQDFEVQIETLQGFSEQLQKEEKTPIATILAIGSLVGSLHHAQQQARDEFAARFEAFTQPHYQDTFRELFA